MISASLGTSEDIFAMLTAATGRVEDKSSSATLGQFRSAPATVEEVLGTGSGRVGKVTVVLWTNERSWSGQIARQIRC